MASDAFILLSLYGQKLCFSTTSGEVINDSVFGFQITTVSMPQEDYPITDMEYSLLAKLELARKLSAAPQSRFSISAESSVLPSFYVDDEPVQE